MKRLVLVVAACGGARPPAEPPSSRAPARPAPAGFVDADLVSFGDGTLAAYAIESEKLVKLGEIRLAPPAPEMDAEQLAMAGNAHQLVGDWVDRDHLAVRIAKDKVVMVTAAGVTELALPDPKIYAIPHSEETSETSSFGKAYTQIDLVVEEGEVWWSRCPFSYPNDGGFCDKWVNARLWPDTEVLVADSPRSPRAFAWRDDPPKGFTLAPEARPRTCTPPGGAPVTLPKKLEKSAETSDEEDYYGEHLFGARWVSASPPKLLVTYGYSSEFDADYVSSVGLFDGCAATPSWTGTEARPGPDGLWESAGTVFRKGTELGAGGDVRFRPSRSANRRAR